jgi:hypothetical protein
MIPPAHTAFAFQLVDSTTGSSAKASDQLAGLPLPI